MAERFSLKLDARIDSSRLGKRLVKLKSDLETKGLNVFKIRANFDEKELKNYSLWVKNATGDTERFTGKIKLTKDEFGKLNPVVKETQTVTQNAAKSTNYFSQGMISAAKSAAQYALAIFGVNALLREMGEGIEYVKELDKEMRNISLITGETGDSINNLASDYNNVAKEMGATTLQVAAGSLEWIRQGKTLEETQELLQATLMLSKLGNVESADAAEHLTAVLNSYKLEAADATRVVDKLVAIDNLSATSVEEMSVAFRKAAVSASAAGIDIDHLAAYVGTVLSVTREAPERVGTAFKTMTARFRDIKAGALDGEGAINNVEAALNRVTLASGEQMSIMDKQTGGFKDFTVVIDQLGKEWKNIDTLEQENIIKSVAGKQTNARMYGNIQVYD